MFASLVHLEGVTDDELPMALREASAAVNRAEAHRLAVAAEWDRRQAWAADGAYSGRCWLADPEPELRCTAAGDGTTHLSGTLDAEGGAIFRTVLEAIADQLSRAEQADPDAQRPPAHLGGRRRAAALVEMARRATAADPTRTGARPLLTVLVDLPTLEARADRPATTDGGGIISAEDARRLACDADVARVITDPDGAILDMGRTARTATPDQWRALRLRDGGCTWPGCDRPPGWCQAHHIIWWEHHGPTDLDNLTLLCSSHHHKIHDNGWHLERHHDGSLHFTGPDGRTLTRPPPLPPWPMPPPPPRIDPIDKAGIRAA